MKRKRSATAKQSKAYEQHCARKMMLRGFFAIEVVGKSGDYGADIIARSWWMRKIVVQCKHYSKPVGVKAVQEINAARQYYGAFRAAVATNSTFTRQARKLANRCGVELWEGF